MLDAWQVTEIAQKGKAVFSFCPRAAFRSMQIPSGLHVAVPDRCAVKIKNYFFYIFIISSYFAARFKRKKERKPMPEQRPTSKERQKAINLHIAMDPAKLFSADVAHTRFMEHFVDDFIKESSAYRTQYQLQVTDNANSLGYQSRAKTGYQERLQKLEATEISNNLLKQRKKTVGSYRTALRTHTPTAPLNDLYTSIQMVIQQNSRITQRAVLKNDTVQTLHNAADLLETNLHAHFTELEAKIDTILPSLKALQEDENIEKTQHTTLQDAEKVVTSNMELLRTTIPDFIKEYQAALPDLNANKQAIKPALKSIAEITTRYNKTIKTAGKALHTQLGEGKKYVFYGCLREMIDGMRPLKQGNIDKSKKAFQRLISTCDETIDRLNTKRKNYYSAKEVEFGLTHSVQQATDSALAAFSTPDTETIPNLFHLLALDAQSVIPTLDLQAPYQQNKEGKPPLTLGEAVTLQAIDELLKAQAKSVQKDSEQMENLVKIVTHAAQEHGLVDANFINQISTETLKSGIWVTYSPQDQNGQISHYGVHHSSLLQKGSITKTIASEARPKAAPATEQAFADMVEDGLETFGMDDANYIPFSR